MAVVFSATDIGDGLSFFSDEADFIQVGSWRYPAGRRLPAHNHNIARRQAARTQEFVHVLRGSLKAGIYDEQDVLLEEVILAPGDSLVCFAGGHGYDILEDDTIVLEVKNGPYVGAENDRRRLGAGT